MVEILEKTTDTCVVVRFGGKVTGEEYKLFLDAVDKRLKAHDKVDMVADLSEFEFYGDFECVICDTSGPGPTVAFCRIGAWRRVCVPRNRRAAREYEPVLSTV